jgi:hypothetical protein
VELNADGVEGARVQWWELSTQCSPGKDWFKDPWHCNANNMPGTPLDKYDWLFRTDFQDEVNMVKWIRPRDWSKSLGVHGQNGRDYGIERKKIHARDVKKVQNHALRIAAAAFDAD